MHLIGLALLAVTAGFFFNWATPKITPMLPAQFQQNRVAQSFITGAFILGTVLAASIVLGMFRVKTPRV